MSNIHSKTSTVQPAAIKKHSMFFIDHEMVAIQVETTLFNIHKQLLEYSETFRDMFILGQQSGLTAEGLSARNPIKLDGILVAEFESFLMILYSHECSRCDNQLLMNGIRSVGPEHILPALRLADMWNFAHHRSYLLDKAFKLSMPIVDQIMLARQYDANSRIRPLYLELCQRQEPLTLGEACKLGLEGTALISHLREAILMRKLQAAFTQEPEANQTKPRRETPPNSSQQRVSFVQLLQQAAQDSIEKSSGEVNGKRTRDCRSNLARPVLERPFEEADEYFLKQEIKEWISSNGANPAQFP
ncbi:hypothetical protein FRC07_002307 [Ceratobasidium sp. 392]|nr:hypothetical protein FRC07_002307 [Ceratobasidium sp. 392]